MERNLNIARKNLDILLKWLEEHKNYFDYVQPKAGVLLFPRLKNIGITTEEMCKELYVRYKLLMMPGECLKCLVSCGSALAMTAKCLRRAYPYFPNF